MADKESLLISKDSILPDLNKSSSNFECKLCTIKFNDAKTYETHINGKKHVKKLSEVKIKAKNGKSDKKAESEAPDSDESDEMHCPICQKNFTGYISYAAHIKGTTHAKNLKKQKLKKQLGDMPEVIKRESKETDKDEDDILPKPYARCSTCQKEFGGPESFNMHLQSSTHLKKIKQEKSMQDLNKDKGENSDGGEIYAKCEICNKQFTGIVPYQIHMKSKVHMKNLEKNKIAEEIKKFCDNTDFSSGYVCKECKKTFTDPMAFKFHLENNSHEKQKAKNALSEFLNAYPEIVYATPYEKEASEAQNDRDESDSMYYLICKLCHVSFSGPESAQDHVKSKKHLKVEREKKMKKLVQQQNNFSGTSDDITNAEEPSNETTSNDDQINDAKEVTEGFEVI